MTLNERTIFSGIESIARRRAALTDLIDGPNPLEIKLDRIISSTSGVIDGRRTVLFGTNNYLGLTFDTKVREAAIRAIWQSGVGTTASRVASGNLPDHYELEREIASFLSKRAALVFSTGFQANLGTIAGLCGSESTIVLDENCHASIFDAVALSTARRLKFRHNDLSHLQTVLSDSDTSRGPVLVVTEAVFSTIGDVAPLQELVRLRSQFGYSLLVDEAHSIGMYGNIGQGYVAELGLTDQVDIITGTLSKSFGLIGGFAASDHPDFFCLRYAARPFMFTAALPPSVVAAARASLAQIARASSKRSRLWNNAARLRSGVMEIGLRTLPNRSPIVPIILDDLTQSYIIWRRLLEGGYYANLLLPPATSHGACVIRLSVCSDHSDEEIDGVLNALADATIDSRTHDKSEIERLVASTGTGIVVPTTLADGSLAGSPAVQSSLND